MVDANDIAKSVGANFECEKVIVQDMSGDCGEKFDVYVVSKAFDGMKILDRHRAVQQALAAEIAQIHAITIKAWTPEQWQAKKGDLPASIRGDE
jgi:stress-induced morphogen